MFFVEGCQTAIFMGIGEELNVLYQPDLQTSCKTFPQTPPQTLAFLDIGEESFSADPFIRIFMGADFVNKL